MAAGKLEIKARIRSVESTKKITKAMQLVATSKLKKQKQYMEENREYAFYLKETVQDILSSIINSRHPYLQKNEGKPFTIVFTSDMGLCGGYNANIYRMLSSEIGNDGQFVMIGSRGVNWSKNKDFEVVREEVDLEDECYSELAEIADYALELYRNKEISQIRILYTHFVNSVTFEPKLVTLLPVEKEQREKKENAQTIFEPAGEQILDTLVPMYVRSMLYSYYLETKTSEQASRRMAMENATDNAEELKETLELQYNQARQAAITQEITEIVGGVNAMEGVSS
ncbi:ATP synthase subunit gamma [Amedibacterium intestinale]|uniref:ATP synthase F1 subunit gamma n=1 Tax=Amedibacterium intestinale TaxID=2583452 RepID=UPI0013739F7F|nr:ATP synthase F1 subunit gamma [Amedibacterium intestinale]BBK63143.1 ATP synthase subunit gamma [Amedibacterium intestinale]